MRFRYLLGICLLLATTAWPGPVFAEKEYFAVFMEGKKVGHAIQSRVVAEGRVTTTEEVSMTISRLNVPVTISMTETSIETIDGKPLGFEAVQELSGIVMKVAGKVNEDGTVNLTATSMGTEQKSTLDWPGGAVMAEGLRLMTLRRGLKEGSSYTTKLFSPAIIQALDAQIRIGPKQNVDLLGRVASLTEVGTDVNMPGAGKITSISYVDEGLRVQKTVMPIAGMQVEMIACTKEFALGENDVLEVFRKMFLPSPEPLEDVGSAKSITYQLSLTEKADDLRIPSTDNQIVRPGNRGKIMVTVQPVVAPTGARFPYKGKDRSVLEARQPNRFLQSDRKEIVDLARGAVGDTKDAAEAVKRIEAFVAKYVENKSLSVGYASAAEVAASKQGDCSEFAVLTAAMCRAIGIPAQMVVGIAYVKDYAGFQAGFGGHAWVRAYVGDRWVGLDAAFKSTGRGGYDAGHIALAVGNGEPADFFNLVSTLGHFKIDEVVVNKGR
ncbi:MAG: transglutaminase-like domain-containing protein [Planctomycetota bacterium]